MTFTELAVMRAEAAEKRGAQPAAMKVVYVAGPFRGKTAWEIECNVRRAEEVGIEVAKLGASPLIPHSNSRFFHGTCSDDFWLDATMALLRKSDAIVMVRGWSASTGATAERAEAMRLGLQVFDDVDELRAVLTR